MNEQKEEETYHVQSNHDYNVHNDASMVYPVENIHKDNLVLNNVAPMKKKEKRIKNLFE